MGLFGDLKDEAISAMIKSKINDKIKEFGNMISFKLDSDAKTIEAAIKLQGEPSDITTCMSYEVLPSDEKGANIKLKNISCSKQWVDIIVRDFLNREQTINIPTKFANIIGLVL